ncbi:MAG TPA: tRNA threonylcarbamoyladenosine dehydratase [Burkholderiaceae bacterium]|nr:tRNA threonylcarbamoyladenosine dehydratase [Burkholderiaceae bacterium]
MRPDPPTPSAVPTEAGAGDAERRFAGAARLYGEAAMRRLRGARVAVVGVGGVGSWAAEALARCAVGRLALIDLDHVAESNANRQIHALGDEFGRAKVIAMADRIRAINPQAEVAPVEEFVTPENVADLLQGFDVVLDCIDQARAKAAMIAWCCRSHQPVVVSGSAGGRLDPTRIRCADLATVQGDALLAGVRQRLRRDHGFPRAEGRRPRPFGVAAIHVETRGAPGRAVASATPAGSGAPLACAGYGSSVVVTAPLGFALAAAAIDVLVSA